jgi:hypothetical protein
VLGAATLVLAGRRAPLSLAAAPVCAGRPQPLSLLAAGRPCLRRSAPIYAGRPGCCSGGAVAAVKGILRSSCSSGSVKASLHRIHRHQPPEILLQLILIGMDVDMQFKLVIYFVS